MLDYRVVSVGHSEIGKEGKGKKDKKYKKAKR